MPGFGVLDEIDGFFKRHSVFEPIRRQISSASNALSTSLVFEGL